MWKQLDMGAGVSLVSEKTFYTVLPSCTAQATTVQLCTYSGKAIPAVGEVEVDVQCQEQQGRLLLIVVEGDGPVLFGRNWLSTICLGWKSINMF